MNPDREIRDQLAVLSHEETEAFPPGDFVREELAARNWTQADLARIIGQSLQHVNMLVRNRRKITPRTAVQLGAAFGSSAEVWLRLQNAYSLYLLEQKRPKEQDHE